MITSEIKVDDNTPSPAPVAAPVQAPPSTWQQLKAMARVIFRFPTLLLSVIENQSRIAQAIATNAAVLNQLAARVSWYEHRVPFLNKEYHAFKHMEKQQIEKAQAAISYAERERRRAEMAVAQ